jgi:hypothetical protein
MGLADSFTWDETPAKDCHTGKRSKASLIPVIKNYVRKLCVFVIAFHGGYFIPQVAFGSRILSINSYYPFDWTVSPLYELVNVVQVGTTGLNPSIRCYERESSLITLGSSA